jgi:hypothetical protein
MRRMISTLAVAIILATSAFIQAQNVEYVGSYGTPSYAQGVYVEGNYAYIADGLAGLLILDIYNPANPSLVGTCDTPRSATGIFVSGIYAFVADQPAGLQIINILNPNNPFLTSNYDTPGEAMAVFVHDTLPL